MRWFHEDKGRTFRLKTFLGRGMRRMETGAWQQLGAWVVSGLIAAAVAGGVTFYSYVVRGASDSPAMKTQENGGGIIVPAQQASGDIVASPSPGKSSTAPNPPSGSHGLATHPAKPAEYAGDPAIKPHTHSQPRTNSDRGASNSPATKPEISERVVTAHPTGEVPSPSGGQGTKNDSNAFPGKDNSGNPRAEKHGGDDPASKPRINGEPPTNPTAALQLFGEGKREFVAGRYEKAIEHFQASLKLNPRDAATYYYLGGAIGRLGDESKKREHWRKGIEVEYDRRIQEGRLDGLQNQGQHKDRTELQALRAVHGGR